jgi:hypothetical protein
MSGFFRESRDILGAFTLVSTIFHPANCPIDFLKSFFLDFFINSVRVRVRVRVRVGLGLGLRLVVRVGVGFGLVSQRI